MNKIILDQKINLDEYIVQDFGRPFIVAEIGQNHNGNIDFAKELIDIAVRCKANAVKFQKRDISSELTTEAYNKVYDNNNSFGDIYGKHREFLEFDESQHLELFQYAKSQNITYFCTPCDLPSLEIMEKIGVPFYKVASRDLTNIPLLTELGKLDKPVIISTGMASYHDIEDALDKLNKKKDELIIMHCTSQYPCDIKNAHLNNIKTLKEKYGYLVGYSDHTNGTIISVAASLLGASVIEKHITIDRAMRGTDHAGALEEVGLKSLINSIDGVRLSLGDNEKIALECTQKAKNKLAKSLTSLRNIRKGEILSEDMICLKSPGNGLMWRNRQEIIGKKAKKNISVDCTLFINDFE
tara:strand:+ start:65 stop:1126 length:1062 start_codon:yes stop_codon:yes gene_type:complete